MKKEVSLPGMENRRIQPLEDAAAVYADLRDRRMALTREEVDLKTTTLKLMKRHGKLIYRHAGITITVIHGEEDVKVKIQKPHIDGEDAQQDVSSAASVEIQSDSAEASDETSDPS